MVGKIEMAAKILTGRIQNEWPTEVKECQRTEPARARRETEDKRT